MFPQLLIFCFGLTLAAEEVLRGAPGSVIAEEGFIGVVGRVDAVSETADTLLSQEPHEKLQANESEHAETEDS